MTPLKILFEARMDAAERTDWWCALTAALPGDDWLDGERATAAERAAAEVAVVANPAPGQLADCRKLLLIQSLWAGVDRLLRDPSCPAAVPLARMVDPSMAAAMAETAAWAVLSLHRGFFDYAAAQRARAWRPLPQRRADEVPVLVLGLGDIGGAVAQRLAGLGYAVRGWRATPQPAGTVAGSHGFAALPAALAAAEVVVNLLPLTPATQSLFDAARLAQMAPGAALVNLARGGHVVEADLLVALDSGRLRHAVLDVFAVEPLPPAHPFWCHPRVTLLPHVAALTDLRSATAVAVANIEAARRGAPLAHLADRQRGY